MCIQLSSLIAKSSTLLTVTKNGECFARKVLTSYYRAFWRDGRVKCVKMIEMWLNLIRSRYKAVYHVSANFGGENLTKNSSNRFQQRLHSFTRFSATLQKLISTTMEATRFVSVPGVAARRRNSFSRVLLIYCGVIYFCWKSHWNYNSVWFIRKNEPRSWNSKKTIQEYRFLKQWNENCERIPLSTSKKYLSPLLRKSINSLLLDGSRSRLMSPRAPLNRVHDNFFPAQNYCEC